MASLFSDLSHEAVTAVLPALLASMARHSLSRTRDCGSLRVSKRLLLVLGYSIGAATALLLALNISSIPALAIVFILGGAYVGVEETLEDSIAAQLLPDVVRGVGFGTMALVNAVGDFISSICVGWLWAISGAPVDFGFALLLTTTSGLGLTH